MAQMTVTVKAPPHYITHSSIILQKKPAAHRWLGPRRTNQTFASKDHKNPEKTDAAGTKKGKTEKKEEKQTLIKINNQPIDDEGILPLSDADILSNAAANATDTKVMLNYKIRLEFPVSEDGKLYNLRSHFSKLMTELQRVDRNIVIGANNRDSE
eukprot:7834929-Ditylum_brightwellii.AAC.1